ncbi:glycine cleavage system protein T [Plantibacter sp. Leaf171]|uniref:glycine cleavage system aminomethyltransferase GcvT n=1 Tax=unclassified Plantibacter TaxID=2624265 RepID=UPI0006F4C843|nr:MULTISPECIES: glycine cleavage system aminomethyltransferase GcvT [unclassified Plantibacter]KQM15588.1 glycine cleavage system protein T [Plantibacter sp. Leaf1]KQR58732.1 glycine cleavage system protein T [Plantibacter sp. Leaf171]
MTDPERTSPLYAVHEAAGASFTDFAGWQMPVRYSSDLAEHHAVRTAAGIFDISHMAEIQVVGEDAAAFLDQALAGRLSAIELLQAKYSLLLNEAGGIIDDLVVYRNGEHEYLVVANAGNREAAVAALTERAAAFEHLAVVDRSDEIALIAVQGPASRAILQATEGLHVLDELPSLDEVKYYRATGASFENGTVFIGRTGYTGEDGFELYVDAADAVELWSAIVAAGTPLGLVPAGLASRDTLRLEAGMPLYGHELVPDMLPVQAGLGRVVALAKHGSFVGRDAIEAGPAADARVLVGLVSEGRRAGRAGYAVLAGDDVVGEVTSGALSPTLGHPIAMAYVHPDHTEPGTVLDLDVRGTRIPATVTTLPFYSREK